MLCTLPQLMSNGTADAYVYNKQTHKFFQVLKYVEIIGRIRRIRHSLWMHDARNI